MQGIREGKQGFPNPKFLMGWIDGIVRFRGLISLYCFLKKIKKINKKNVNK